jgi:hypothetical protein
MAREQVINLLITGPKTTGLSRRDAEAGSFKLHAPQDVAPDFLPTAESASSVVKDP